MTSRLIIEKELDSRIIRLYRVTDGLPGRPVDYATVPLRCVPDLIKQLATATPERLGCWQLYDRPTMRTKGGKPPVVAAIGYAHGEIAISSETGTATIRTADAASVAQAIADLIAEEVYSGWVEVNLR